MLAPSSARVLLDEPGRMLLLAAGIQEMHHALAVCDKPVRYVGAVAGRRIAFSAHDADAAVDRGQGAGGGLELLRLHVVGVGGAHAAEGLAFPAIGDAGFHEGSREGVLGELRMAARSRIGAHVDERADAGFPEDCDELLGAAGAVADRENQAAWALASFFSLFAVCSGFLEAFLLPFFSSSPAAGCAPSSARSISVTSARGALSPLRKPVFRMRR